MSTPSRSKIAKLLLNIEYSTNISSLEEQHNLIQDELDVAYDEQDRHPHLCDDTPDAKEHNAYIAILVNVRTLIDLRHSYLDDLMGGGSTKQMGYFSL